MSWYLSLLVLVVIECLTLVASAQNEDFSDAQLAVLKQKFQELKPRTGTISLGADVGILQLPAGFQYLDGKDAKTMLVDFWGNPPESADGVLGMIVESPERAISETGVGIVITYTEDGHVDDKDAQAIDYAELLKNMQAATDVESKERIKQGFSAARLVGWAEAPSYDISTHKLFWAKELQFNGEPDNTLNYCTRILGRRGVLELNAVSTVGHLDEVRRQMQLILASVDFTAGNRYADFNAATDKLAAYGIAALVAGGVAAKMGVFKAILVALLAAKKLVVVAIIALGAAIAKIFKKK